MHLSSFCLYFFTVLILVLISGFSLTKGGFRVLSTAALCIQDLCFASQGPFLSGW